MKRKAIKTSLLVFLLTLMFSITVFAKEPTVRTECNEAVYTNTTSNIRTQPTTSAKKAGTVPKGTELLRTAVLDNGWSEIQYNGNVCYISSKLINTQPVNTETASTSTSVPTGSGSGTKTFSNGVMFVSRGQTPSGLNIWYLSDDDGTWPDYMIKAYDATGITNDMSDYDKAVAINNYICRVVDYAYENGVDDRATYSACLTYGKAICGGYSHAFDCLCTMAGVYSNQVGGLAGGGSHMWNYVLIDGTKYWVDVTWNDESNNSYLMSTSQFADHEFGYEK